MKKIILLLGLAAIALVILLSGCATQNSPVCGDGVCESPQENAQNCSINNDGDCPPATTQTCSQQNGNICVESQECDGNWLNVSDSQLCCNGNCITRIGSVCGNGVCEKGEADTQDCPVCNGADCPKRPCFLKPGTCPQDCQPEHDDCKDVNLEGDFFNRLLPKITAPDSNITFVADLPYEYRIKRIYLGIENSNNEIVKKIWLSKDNIGRYEFTASEPGEYSINLCNKQLNTFTIVENLSCEPLFSTNAEREKDRINIVFVGAKDYGSVEAFKQVAKELVSLDGNYRVIPELESGGAIRMKSLDWGLLSIPPIREQKSKFNFWYLNTLIDNPNYDYIYDNPEFTNQLSYCGLSHAYTAILSNESSSSNPNANSPNFVSEKTVEKNNIKFGSSINYITILPDGQINQRKQFVHETGHALFGLRDEYGGNRAISYGYPSCAQNIEEARNWWGEFEGNLDSFFYEYKTALEENGIEHSLQPSDFVTGYFYGGCYAPDGDESVVRPTKESIMGFGNTAIFGTVNSERIKQILNLFTG